MTKRFKDKTRINFVVPDNVLAATKKIAKMRGTSYSEVIRQALRDFVIQELKKEKDNG